MRYAAAALDVRAFSRMFKALGDETRVRIIALLSRGELCVCHIEAALGLRQPTVSRHLALLRAAALVEARRDGTWVYYRLAAQPDTGCRRMLGALVRDFAAREALQRDVERLRPTGRPGACRLPAVGPSRRRRLRGGRP